MLYFFKRNILFLTKKDFATYHATYNILVNKNNMISTGKDLKHLSG